MDFKDQLGFTAPIMIPDSDVSMCQVCPKKSLSIHDLTNSNILQVKVNPLKFRFMESLPYTAILNFAPIQQEAKHDQEKLSAEQK